MVFAPGVLLAQMIASRSEFRLSLALTTSLVVFTVRLQAAAAGTTSTAPISTVPPGGWGLATPRWSVAGAPALSPALMTGLPVCGKCVCVAPPLSASGPSSGFCPVMLPVVMPAIVQPVVV